MRYIVSAFSRILIVFGMLIFFAGPLHADPVVTFALVGAQQPATAVPNLMNITLGAIGPTGSGTIVFQNTSNLHFSDFHFESSTQSAVWGGNGSPFFSVAIGNPTASGIDFFQGTGFGIAPGTFFSVNFAGFQTGSVITARATIPEPATMLLLGTGLAGVAIKTRKRLKNRKSG